jgi:hypothetical protein
MTETKSLAEDVRSFITFALAMKPGVVMHTKTDHGAPRMSLTISAERAEVEEKVASLEPLMEKYRPLRSYLNALRDSEETVESCVATTTFTPGVEYRLVRIPQEQFVVAKELATRLDRIHVLNEGGYSEEANSEYDALQQYLANQREILIGDFKGLKFSDAVATYGADHMTITPDDSCVGVIKFIIIEIFIG